MAIYSAQSSVYYGMNISQWISPIIEKDYYWDFDSFEREAHRAISDSSVQISIFHRDREEGRIPNAFRVCLYAADWYGSAHVSSKNWAVGMSGIPMFDAEEKKKYDKAVKKALSELARFLECKAPKYKGEIVIVVHNS